MVNTTPNMTANSMNMNRTNISTRTNRTITLQESEDSTELITGSIIMIHVT